MLWFTSTYIVQYTVYNQAKVKFCLRTYDQPWPLKDIDFRLFRYTEKQDSDKKRNEHILYWPTRILDHKYSKFCFPVRFHLSIWLLLKRVFVRERRFSGGNSFFIILNYGSNETKKRRVRPKNRWVGRGQYNTFCKP